MRDNITTIPVKEIFEVNDGCPLCRLRDAAEERVLEFVMGGAMMEPDVRMKTNELGFCGMHYKKMLERQNKLAVALMIQSHLDEISKSLFEKGKLPFSKEGYKKKYSLAGEITETCFICEKTQWGLERLFATVCTAFAEDTEFRKLFEEQPTLCLPHYYMLTNIASENLGKKAFAELNDAAAGLCKKGLEQLKTDIDWFCRKHDYRNADKPWGNSKDAIERSVKYLTSR